MYDFKPSILMLVTFILPQVDNILHTSLLSLNFLYISYQFYSFHKNKNDKNEK